MKNYKLILKGNLILLAVSIFTYLPVLGQVTCTMKPFGTATTVEFDVASGGSASDLWTAITSDGQGGAYTNGITRSFAFDQYNDNWLGRFDQNGNQLFTKSYGGRFDDEGAAIVRDPASGDVWTAGSTRTLGRTSFSHDIWVLRVDANGNQIFSETYLEVPGNHINDHAYGIILDGKGGVYVTGAENFISNRTLKREVFVMQVNGSGSLLWSTTYGGSLDDVGRDLLYDPVTGNYT